jgi:hypothetical protein
MCDIVMFASHGYAPAMKQEAPKRQPSLDDVLRRMLRTPPDPHAKAAKKKSKKRAK